MSCHLAFCKHFGWDAETKSNCLVNDIEKCEALKLSNEAPGDELFCVWTYLKDGKKMVGFATTCGEDFPIWELPNKSYKFCPGCGHKIKGENE